MPQYYKKGHSICTRYGEWLPPVPPCMPVKDCHDPILPPNLKFSSMCNQQIGVSCPLSCENNLTLIGPSNITCRENGSWSEMPICGCKHPPLLPNAIIDNNCQVQIGSGCLVSCRADLKLLGSSTIKCLPNGKWNVTSKCVRFCPQLTSFSGIEILNDCSHLEGSVCRIGCTDDLILRGSDNVTCLQNGKWSSMPQCGCDKPSTPNAEISVDCDLRPYGRCLIRCKSGYALIGSSIVSCHPAGGWYPPSFCVSKTEEGNCPRSYYYFAGQCYKIHRRVTGFEALNVCRHPSHALVIDRGMVYSFIVALMRTQKLDCAWTGINDLQRPGIWKDSLGRVVYFLPWSFGHPTITQNGECVLMSEFDGYRYQAHSCYLAKCNVICQRREKK